MKTIASFTVNHDTLKKGMYISRIDGDVITYDIRMNPPTAAIISQTADMCAVLAHWTEADLRYKD